MKRQEALNVAPFVNPYTCLSLRIVPSTLIVFHAETTRKISLRQQQQKQGNEQEQMEMVRSARKREMAKQSRDAEKKMVVVVRDRKAQRVVTMRASKNCLSKSSTYKIGKLRSEAGSNSLSMIHIMFIKWPNSFCLRMKQFYFSPCDLP